MKKFYTPIIISSLLFLKGEMFAQNIAINTTGAAADPSAVLDILHANKGLLIPRVALTGVNDNATIATPANSLLVYCTGAGGLAPAGYYYNSGTTAAPVWVQVGAGGGSGWLLAGNALTGGLPSTPNEFIGSTNNYDWVLKTNNTEKVRVTAGGFMGIGTVISIPSQLLHLASSGSSTVLRYETQNVTTGSANASVGPAFSTSCIDDATVGTVAWTTPGNAVVSDASYATALLTNATSHYLKATGFGFAIPGTATILGIVVEWQKKSSTSGASGLDNAIRIVKAGVIGATDRSSLTQWSTIESWITYGSNVDLWGQAWTPADINAANFGAALSAKDGAAVRTFSVNSCRITVYYSTPVVGTIDWSAGTDYSDFGKYKISKAATLTSNNFVAVDGTGDVGIGTSAPNASALLDVSSATKGVRIPNVALTTTGSALPVISPATSLLVYNTATVSDVTPGYYYWDGAKWVGMGTSTNWSLLGNAGTVDGTNFLGTTDNIPLSFRVNNQVSGRMAPVDLNTSFGYQSLLTGTGYGCVAIGHQALMSNQRNNDGLALGWGNVCVGYQSMMLNTDGRYNTCLGNGTLQNNTVGEFNSAVGNVALFQTTGNGNAAVGAAAMFNITSGFQNTAIGGGARPAGSVGTGDRVTTGSNNSFLGYLANVAAGGGAFTNATAIGAFAQVGASNCLVLGSINGVNGAVANTNVGIGCQTPTQALYVVGNIYATGNVLGTQAACSDVRWKKDFVQLDNALDKILQLSGYYYQFKTKEFPDKKFSDARQLGMKAQDVEMFFPELIFTDQEGYKYLDYSRLTPVLVEAIKDQQKMINSLKLENENMQSGFGSLKTENKNLKAELSSLKSDYDNRLKKIEELLDAKAEK